jgi:hypothetical protein
VSRHLRSLPDPPLTPRLDSRVHDALCNLYAYVLVLDSEWREVTVHLQVLAEIAAAAPERRELVRRENDLRQELHSLRAMIARLRRDLDPEGVYL